MSALSSTTSTVARAASPARSGRAGTAGSWAARSASSAKASSAIALPVVADVATAAGAMPTRCAGRCATPSGTRTTKRLPRPGALVTSTLPPCRRTSSLTSARPMPVPSCERARHAVETIEHMGERVVVHADAGVAHLQHGLARLGVQRDRDLAVERELERVRQQVQDHLLPHVDVDEHLVRERLA